MPDGLQRVRRTARQLRFRLTASYLLFFTAVYVLVGVAVRQVLRSNQETQNRLLLEEQWGALSGYLRFRSNGLVWSFNENKAEEHAIVQRLRQVFFLTDSAGNVLEISPAYQLIGADPSDEIQRTVQSNRPEWKERLDSEGIPYLIRSGVLSDRRGREYYASIGRSLLANRAVLRHFTWNYFAALPLIILAGGIFGWFLTANALRPLNELLRTARRITGSNLSLRIPPRGAGDELDHLIETFNQMMDRLEESFRLIKQFSTDVSHELRTPITVIRGQLEVALFTAETSEQYREAMQNALEETERLSQLVNTMLLLSQAESGQLLLKKEPRDVSALVRDVVEQFEVAAEEARLHLKSDLAPGCIAVVDRLQFDRLVSNLLTNSFKYTPEGGEVRVEVSRRNGNVELVVADTGHGIPAEHLPHIFDRFYRVPAFERGESRGMGLGLNFVAWIVKAHGGRIAVDSTVGKGSRFQVTIPESNRQSERLERRPTMSEAAS